MFKNIIFLICLVDVLKTSSTQVRSDRMLMILYFVTKIRSNRMLTILYFVTQIRSNRMSVILYFVKSDFTFSLKLRKIPLMLFFLKEYIFIRHFFPTAFVFSFFFLRHAEHRSSFFLCFVVISNVQKSSCKSKVLIPLNVDIPLALSDVFFLNVNFWSPAGLFMDPFTAKMANLRPVIALQKVLRFYQEQLNEK